MFNATQCISKYFILHKSMPN